MSEFLHGGPPRHWHPVKLAAEAPGLHPLERLLVTLAAINLMFIPWAIGGMVTWSIWTSLIISTAAFVVALLPRTYSAELGGGEEFRMIPWRRLVRFPVFWAGILFLLYVLVQALNPAYIRIADPANGYWWMRRLDPVSWLPQGMIAPFKMNPWRCLVIHAPAWMLMCALWTGITRRRSVVLLLNVMVANAAVFAVLALAQRFSHAKEILWLIKVPRGSDPLGTFVYRNHGAAYLNLMVALSAGMAWWYWMRSQRNLERSSPALLYSFLPILIGVAVVYSYGRMAIILLLVLLLVVLTGVMIRQFRGLRGMTSPWVLVSLIIVFFAFTAFGLVMIGLDPVIHRFSQLDPDSRYFGSVSTRIFARNATWDMFLDNWLLGWGGGCFRWYFPAYSIHYPAIFAHGRAFWAYAHCDLLQYPVEFGALGMLPVLYGTGFWAWRLLKGRCWLNPVTFCIALSTVLLLVHAFVDFPLSNPAILITSCSLVTCAGLLLQWERR